jgi:hypothetical protein
MELVVATTKRLVVVTKENNPVIVEVRPRNKLLVEVLGMGIAGPRGSEGVQGPEGPKGPAGDIPEVLDGGNF